MGSYLVLIEGGMKVYKPVVVNLVPEWNETEAEWELKADVPTELTVKYSEATIEKKVSDTADNSTTLSDWAQVDIGDTVTYTLTAAVPTFPEDAINKGCQISDTLPEGMTLNNDSFTVYGMTGKEDANPTQLTPKQTADANDGAYYVATINATRPVDADNDKNRDRDLYFDRNKGSRWI